MGTFDHDHTTSIENAADDSYTKIPNAIKTDNNNRNIAVGQSSGGLVARQMDKKNQNTSQADAFGGFITTDTQNSGAYFVNAFQNGELEGFFTDFCREVFTEPLEVYFLSPLDNGLCDGLFGLLESNLGDFTDPIVDDFKVGADFITDINAFQTDKPRVAIWGNEESPVHWRLLSSGANRPFTLPINDGTNDGDEELVETMLGIQNLEYVVGYFFLNAGISKLIAGGFIPELSIPAVACMATGIEFLQGANWLKNSETAWLELIDANGVSYHAEESLVFICVDELEEIATQDPTGDGPGYHELYEMLQCDPECWEMTVISVPIYSHGANDGILNKSTQQLFGDGVANLEAVGTNHFEAVNHKSVMDAMSSVFNGDIEGVDAFFITN